jgi:hypothetical protein
MKLENILKVSMIIAILIKFRNIFVAKDLL